MGKYNSAVEIHLLGYTKSHYTACLAALQSLIKMIHALKEGNMHKH